MPVTEYKMPEFLPVLPWNPPSPIEGKALGSYVWSRGTQPASDHCWMLPSAYIYLSWSGEQFSAENFKWWHWKSVSLGRRCLRYSQPRAAVLATWSHGGAGVVENSGGLAEMRADMLGSREQRPHSPEKRKAWFWFLTCPEACDWISVGFSVESL